MDTTESTASPPPPSAPPAAGAWLWLDVAAKWVWRAALAFWALLVITALLLHFWIVPRLGDLKDDVAHWASQQSGLRIEIDSLDVVSHVFWASVEAKGISVSTIDGRRVLSLPKTTFDFSARSLLAQSVDRLVMDELSLELGRDEQGRWTVAGLPLQPSDDAKHPLAQWLLNQPQLQLRQARLSWREHASEPVEWLNQVDLEMSAGLFQHRFNLRATPALADMGQRFGAMGRFSEPLFTGRSGDPSTWQGEVYLEASELSAKPWFARWQLKAPIEFNAKAAVRAWFTVDAGEIRRADVDLQTDHLQLNWPQRSRELSLHHIQGRVTYTQDKGGVVQGIKTDDLRFETATGEPWPRTSLSLNWSQTEAGDIKSIAVQAARIDLSVLSNLAHGLELRQDELKALDKLKLDGQIKDLALSWELAQPNKPPKYAIKATGSQLRWAAVETGMAGLPWIPGLTSANAELTIQEGEGRLNLKIDRGEVHLPGLLAEARVPIDAAQLAVKWHHDAKGTEVEFLPSQVSNRDLRGSWQGSWKRDPSTSALGRLSLSAEIQEAQANRVFRYLPSSLPADVIRYVQQTVRAGKVSQAKFEVKGDLDRFPFANSKDERFEVKAKLLDLVYQYVPDIRGQALQWPGFANLDADFDIKGLSMAIRKASAKVVGHPGVNWKNLEARIADLSRPVVDVTGSTQSDLVAVLAVVRQSPIAGLIQDALSDTTGSGRTSLELGLRIPLDQIDKTTVNGKLALDKAQVRLSPSIPDMNGVTGDVLFTESRLLIPAVRAQVLGAEARLEGGLAFTPQALADSSKPTTLKVSGVATAAGLRNQRQLAWLARLAEQFEGSARYEMGLFMRDGQLNWLLSSNLLGLSSSLPAPLDKMSGQSLPLRLESRSQAASTTATRANPETVLSLNVGQVLRSQYVVRTQASGALEPLSGALYLGNESAALPTPANRSIVWQWSFSELDLEPWQKLWRRLDMEVPASALPSPRTARPATPEGMYAWLPTQLNFQTDRLVAAGRNWQSVQARATRKAQAWDIDLKGVDFLGSGQYLPARADQAAELNFQFQRLVIPPSLATSVEDALTSDGPRQMPALKVSVQSLTLRGKPWGRVDIEAVSRALPQGGRDWQLQRFDLTLPEAKFKAKGDWNPARLSQQTRLDFTLEVQDGGAFMSRLGVPGAVRSGQGKLAGNLGWQSSPMSPSLKSMSGQFNMNIEKGQFLKSEPGVGRFFGILSLQSLPRRLTLDFRDVFSQGFAFDYFRGDVSIEKGVARTNNLQMKGVSAGVFMEGWANVNEETHDLKVVVVPEINAGTASLFYSTINPVVGLTSFLAQYVLRQPLIKANTDHLHIYGTWSDPTVDTIDPESGKVLSTTKDKSP